jgi:hypothetical protein
MATNRNSATGARLAKPRRPRYRLSGVDRQIEAWVVREIACLDGVSPAEVDQKAAFARALADRKAFADDFNARSKKIGWGAAVDPAAFAAATATGSIARAIGLLCRAVPHGSRTLDLIENVSAQIQFWAVAEIASLNGVSTSDVNQALPFNKAVNDPKAFADDFNAKSGTTPAWRGAQVDPPGFAAAAAGGSIAHAIMLLCGAVYESEGQ